MSGFDFREFIQAASAAAIEGGATRPSRRRQRTPTAEGVADIDMRPSYSPVVLEGAVRLVEFAIVAALGVLVHQVYLAGFVPFDFLYGSAVIGLAALTVLVFQAAGAYAVSAFRAFFLFGLRIIAAWSLVILIALMVVFFAKIGGNLSRVWLASLYFLGAGALIVERLILSFFVSAMTRAGRFDRRTAIVGGGQAAEAMIKALDAQPETGIRIVGLFDDRDEARSPDVVAGYPKMGTVDDLVEYARRTKLDLVVFTLPISAERRILQMLAKL
jgi:FlaA1/EpsC-like NDP-sugar epimerase